MRIAGRCQTRSVFKELIRKDFSRISISLQLVWPHKFGLSHSSDRGAGESSELQCMLLPRHILTASSFLKFVKVTTKITACINHPVTCDILKLSKRRTYVAISRISVTGLVYKLFAKVCYPASLSELAYQDLQVSGIGASTSVSVLHVSSGRATIPYRRIIPGIMTGAA